MSPRRSVEARRREDVLAATWDLITEVGYGRIRIADIADRVGTSTGTIHYYFKTKEEVLEETFRFMAEKTRRRSERALTGVEDPWGRLEALIDAHLPRGAVRKEWVIWLQLWNEAVVNRSLRSLNRTSYGGWIDLMEKIVRDGQDCGAFRRIDAHEFVLRLLTMMDGLVIQYTTGSTEVDLDRLRELLLGFASEQLLPAER